MILETGVRRLWAGALTLLFTIAPLTAAAAPAAAELVAEGNELYKKGDMEGALKKYLEAQTLKPGAPELHFNIGDVHFGKGKFEDAATEFRRIAPAADRKLLPALAYNLATSLVKQKQPEKAIDLYKAAIKLDPSDLEARYNLGVLLAQQQKQQQQQGDPKQQQDQKDQKDQKQQDSQQQQPDQQKQQKQDAQQQQSGQQNPKPAPKPEDQKQASKPEEKKDDKDKKADAASAGKPGEKPPEKQIQGVIPREQAERLLDLLKEEERRGVFLAQPQPAVPEQDPEKDW